MCKCKQHSFFRSEYATMICRNCGLEEVTSLPPSEGYTENIPLELGYSRYTRMQRLLNQLFLPTRYGSPNSRVVFEVLQQEFSDGCELLAWLSKLPLKNKRYQNSHYYFAVHNKTYRVPEPPHVSVIYKILILFSKLERWFETRQHPYKSFFSYNWLLRYFLKTFCLPHYLQFVKQIKCRKRVKMYERMFQDFTISDNVPKGGGVSQMNQTQLDVLPGGVHSFQRVLRRALDRSRENRQNS